MLNKKEQSKPMAKIVERNINALIDHYKEEDLKKNTEENIADRITKFTGSITFVYLHIAFFGIWIIWNSGLFKVTPFDKSYVILAMFASVEAIFLSTFVLISQNRMAAQADKRAELDLQVSLLAEHEITRLITLVAAIAKKLELEEAEDPEIEELEKDVHPEKVMDTMEKIAKNKNK